MGKKNQKQPTETIATWYGRAGLQRAFCKKCQTTAFIIDGCFKCCDSEIQTEVKTTSNIRICDSQRGKISIELKRKILFTQRHKCHYCGLDLSQTWYYLDKYGELKQIQINFDHFLPVAYLASETFDNLYAVCSLCNRYKSSKIFDSIQECQDYIKKKLDKLNIKIWSIEQAEDFLTK